MSRPARDPLGFREAPRTTRRRCGRLFVSGVECGLGSVTDISASGMRVSSKRKPPVMPQDRLVVKVTSPVGDFTANCRIIAVDKSGLFAWTIRVVYDEMPVDAREVLTRIASSVSREMNESFTRDRRAG